jgi:hypothetical protein
MKKWFTAVALLLAFIGAALAQSIGGNASLSVTASSSNVQLTANVVNYPALLIDYNSAAPTVEVFYALGTSNTVAATTSSPALPPGGICINGGPNTWVAAIGSAAGPTVVRITQLSVCPWR